MYIRIAIFATPCLPLVLIDISCVVFVDYLSFVSSVYHGHDFVYLSSTLVLIVYLIPCFPFFLFCFVFAMVVR